MKVAVIGAGVSGLSCVFRLNQLGIRPTVFERRSMIGEVINLYGIHLDCFNHVSSRPLRFFRKKYNLTIEPMADITEITMHAGKREVHIKGRLGCIFSRGAQKNSLEKQLYRQVEGDFYFDTYIMDMTLDDIKRQFDAVVVATGDPDIADAIGIWTEAAIVQTRSGIFYGDYQCGNVINWMNTAYAKSAYAYLVPITNKKAMMTLLVNGVTTDELDYYWKRMILAEGFRNNMIETWDYEFHNGKLKTNRINNLWFIGNTGGMTDDFLGLGIINGIVSGIYAADAIILGRNYEEDIKPILRRVEQLHYLRKLADDMNNRAWQCFVTMLGLPGVRHCIYQYSLLKFHHMGKIAGWWMRK